MKGVPLDKRGRRIRNIDFLTALRKSNAKYARMEVTHFSNTVNDGILYARMILSSMLSGCVS